MRLLKILLAILVVSFFIQCTKEKYKNDLGPDIDNFEGLDDIAKNSKIIALGYASIGYGSLLKTQIDLIKYLHENHGYDIICLESSFGDAYMINNFLENETTARQFRDNITPSMLKLEDNLALFKYQQSDTIVGNQLKIYGYDPRISSKGFLQGLNQIIGRFEPKVIQDSVRNGFLSYFEMYKYKAQSDLFYREKAQVQSAIDLSREIFDTYEEDILALDFIDESFLKAIQFYISSYEKLIDFEIDEIYTRGIMLRDSLMAENVNFLVENNPNSKIVLWGHNGHIEKGKKLDIEGKWFGHHLKEKYGDDYYSIGSSVMKGNTYNISDKTINTFSLMSDQFIEGKVFETYFANTLVKFNGKDEWQKNPLKSVEPEAGGEITYIPQDRFDAIIILEETVPSTPSRLVITRE